MTAVGKVSVAASLAMLAWMGRSIVTGEIPFTGDLLHFHYAVRDFYARALAAGHGFDWIPGLFGGYYLVGEGQLGGYHPLHLLLYRMLPLDRALAVELVAAYPFMFAGTWLWMRRWCGESAAAFGAMTATFCGFMLVHGVHPNMVGVVAHVPWLLWALDNAAASRSAAGFDRRGTARHRLADRLAVPPRVPAIRLVLGPRQYRVRGASDDGGAACALVHRPDVDRGDGAWRGGWRRADSGDAGCHLSFDPSVVRHVVRDAVFPASLAPAADLSAISLLGTHHPVERSRRSQ